MGAWMVSAISRNRECQCQKMSVYEHSYSTRQVNIFLEFSVEYEKEQQAIFCC